MMCIEVWAKLRNLVLGNCCSLVLMLASIQAHAQDVSATTGTPGVNSAVLVPCLLLSVEHLLR